MINGFCSKCHKFVGTVELSGDGECLITLVNHNHCDIPHKIGISLP